MPSLKSAPADRASRPAANRVADERLLDAAMGRVLAVGVRRTTLTEVARAAGVSRMTLYRRFPDVTSLVAALMTREFGAVLRESARDMRRGELRHGELSARERLVAAAVRSVRLLAANPLLRVVLRIDTELLLPYLVDRIGSTQRIAEQFIAEQLAEGHRDGSVRNGATAVQARTFYLTVQAMVISLRPATGDLDGEAVLAELACQLDGALRPAQPPRPVHHPGGTEDQEPAPAAPGADTEESV